LRKLAAVLFILLGMLLTFSVPHARAQAVYGSLYGAVSDTSGGAVVGANVTVTDTSKGTSTTVETNASGEYTAQHLIPDLYDISFKHFILSAS
jgi:hypothetical protein